MIAETQVDGAIESGEIATRLSKAEITQVPDEVAGFDHGVPVGNEGFIHVFDIIEWPLAVTDDVGVTEMGIGSEPELGNHGMYLSFFGHTALDINAVITENGGPDPQCPQASK